MNVSIHNNSGLKHFRKKLRNNSTKSERHLWTFLKGGQLGGIKFRRQHNIGPYVVDFYSCDYNLSIELDGEVHDNPEVIKHDLRRDAFMKNQGIVVLRIRNHEVFEDIEMVLNKIKSFCK